MKRNQSKVVAKTYVLGLTGRNISLTRPIQNTNRIVNLNLSFIKNRSASCSPFQPWCFRMNFPPARNCQIFIWNSILCSMKIFFALWGESDRRLLGSGSQAAYNYLFMGKLRYCPPGHRAKPAMNKTFNGDDFKKLRSFTRNWYIVRVWVVPFYKVPPRHPFRRRRILNKRKI